MSGGVDGLWTSNSGDDVSLTNPRPKDHYGWFRDSSWHYVNDELAQTFILGSTAGVEPGDDWILSFTGKGVAETDRGRVCARLASRALHELYIETRDLSSGARQTGHTAECGFCGRSASLEKVIPNKREELVRRYCYVDAYGGPVRMEDY